MPGSIAALEDAAHGLLYFDRIAHLALAVAGCIGNTSRGRDVVCKDAESIVFLGKCAGWYSQRSWSVVFEMR